MKKTLSLLLIVCLLTALCACGRTPAPTAVVATPAPELLSTPAPAPEAAPSAPPVANTAPDVDWAGIYRSFLLENFDVLSQACYGFVAGVGFIDLDLDTVPELLVFDAGASSSMGVQFFDIVDGAVVCVSASSVEVGGRFHGDWFDPALNVNTTSFDAFRMREAADGRLFFDVTSYNGAEDFRYSERIRFLSRDGVLGLETLACEITALNAETQEVLYTVYTQGDTPIDLVQYSAILSEADAAADLGYEARGAFIWEDPSFGQDLTGFTAMLDAAVAAYQPAL